MLQRVNFEPWASTGLIESTRLYQESWSPPNGLFNIKVTMIGPRLQLWVDGEPVFDVIDPEPYLFGGVGLFTV